ncbi:polysaccharide deacetylase family protein [Parasphingorhabdus sp.]|uniref:polysaccharide deacetylase family protein n=1 Tax=Parasphingorhabdus sp. TaxID=2709688 RepID=UPI0030034D87
MSSNPILLTAIHDVSPRFANEVDILFDRLAPSAGSDHIAMLVVPDFWGIAPLSKSPSFRRSLQNWSDQGVEIFLHGWHHRADQVPQSRFDRFRGNFLTAGEGEFLAMDRARAAKKMRDGRKLIEDITGSPVSGFIAPAWLYGAGAHEALAEVGFVLAEDHMHVWNPVSGETLATGPVVTWASRSAMRTASSLAFASVAPAILSRSSVARIAVHPGDVSKPSILSSIDHCISRLGRQGRLHARYSDLLPVTQGLVA